MYLHLQFRPRLRRCKIWWFSHLHWFSRKQFPGYSWYILQEYSFYHFSDYFMIQRKYLTESAIMINRQSTVRFFFSWIILLIFEYVRILLKGPFKVQRFGLLMIWQSLSWLRYSTIHLTAKHRLPAPSKARRWRK